MLKQNLIGKILLFLSFINCNYLAYAQNFKGYWVLDSMRVENSVVKVDGYFLFQDSTYEALEVREASRTGFLKGKWTFYENDSILWYQGNQSTDSFSVILVKLTDEELIFKNRSITPSYYFLTKKKISSNKSFDVYGKWFFNKILSLPDAIENEDFTKEFEQKIKNKSYIEILKTGEGTTFYSEKLKNITWILSADRKYLIFWVKNKKVPSVYRIKKRSKSLEVELFDGYWFELKKN